MYASLCSTIGISFAVGLHEKLDFASACRSRTSIVLHARVPDSNTTWSVIQGMHTAGPSQSRLSAMGAKVMMSVSSCSKLNIDHPSYFALAKLRPPCLALSYFGDSPLGSVLRAHG